MRRASRRRSRTRRRSPAERSSCKRHASSSRRNSPEPVRRQREGPRPRAFSTFLEQLNRQLTAAWPPRGLTGFSSGDRFRPGWSEIRGCSMAGSAGAGVAFSGSSFRRGTRGREIAVGLLQRVRRADRGLRVALRMAVGCLPLVLGLAVAHADAAPGWTTRSAATPTAVKGGAIGGVVYVKQRLHRGRGLH